MDDTTDPLVALQTVLDVVRFERELQIDQFDGIDAKAGAMVGFTTVALGVIGAIVATSTWWWAVPFLPSAGAAAHTLHHGYQAMRVREIHRQSAQGSYKAWGALGPEAALRQAIADETRTLAANNSIVGEKVRSLKSTQHWFGWTAGLLVAGVILTPLARALWALPTL